MNNIAYNINYIENNATPFAIADGVVFIYTKITREGYIMRYITTNASNRIPLEVQLLMWHMYDTMLSKVKERDYFQVFELYINPNGSQKIVHSQEVPEWKEESILIVKLGVAVNEKVYIIRDELEDGYAETMLLAEDY